jgi:hypothetical protein
MTLAEERAEMQVDLDSYESGATIERGRVGRTAEEIAGLKRGIASLNEAIAMAPM